MPRTKHGGLCSTCANAPTCTFPRDPARPVLQCEEFEVHASPPAKAASEKTSPPPGPDRGEKAAGEYAGLCSTCEDRETCTYPNGEGGVWQCEECR